MGRTMAPIRISDVMDEPKLTDNEYADAWVTFAIMSGFHPTSHITMTFDRNRGINITPERAFWEWRYLVKRLNGHLGGGKYRHKWGHSYFGYIFACETHKDGVFHAHALVDNWISWSMVHNIWNERCGYAWVKPVDDCVPSLKYVVKYCMKSAIRPSFYFIRKGDRRIVDPAAGTVFRASPASLLPDVKGVGS